MEQAETIDLYLLRLGVALTRRFPDDESQVLRILLETEDHLRQAVEKGRDAGLEPGGAESEAIRQFGSPETVAQRFGRELGYVPYARGSLVSLCAHLGALLGALVAASGAASLVLSALAAIFGPLTVLGVADPPPSYYLPLCESSTALELAVGQECARDSIAARTIVSHLWLTVGGAVALVVGATAWGALRVLVLRRMGGWQDRSLPARVHAVLGTLVFGLVGLLLWPIFAAALFSSDVSLPPPIGPSLAGGALVTAVFFLAYVWYARSVYAQPA